MSRESQTEQAARQLMNHILLLAAEQKVVSMVDFANSDKNFLALEKAINAEFLNGETDGTPQSRRR